MKRSGTVAGDHARRTGALHHRVPVVAAEPGVALPFCHVQLAGRKPLPPAYPRRLNTLGDHLGRRRLDLGLFQREVAGTLGVAEQTICNWETNRTSPQLCFIPRILAFLGYDPYAPSPQALGERIIAARRRLGLGQKTLAGLLHIDPGTLGRWERGIGSPSKELLRKLDAFLTSDLSGHQPVRTLY